MNITITGNVILTVINIILWYLLFFKTKKYTREQTQKGQFSWENKYGPWSNSGERYKFPLWMIIVMTLAMLDPASGLMLHIGFYVVWSCLDSMVNDEMECIKLERPKLILQTFFSKTI